MHVELAQHHQPQGPQLLHHRRIGMGAALAVSGRARTAWPALHVDVVFDGDGQTVPRAQGLPLVPALLALTRLGQAARGVHPQIGVQRGVVLGDARQVMPAGRHRPHATLGELLHPKQNRMGVGVGQVGHGGKEGRDGMGSALGWKCGFGGYAVVRAGLRRNASLALRQSILGLSIAPALTQPPTRTMGPWSLGNPDKS